MTYTNIRIVASMDLENNTASAVGFGYNGQTAVVTTSVDYGLTTFDNSIILYYGSDVGGINPMNYPIYYPQVVYQYYNNDLTKLLYNGQGILI